jgi:hypothetical protein
MEAEKPGSVDYPFSGPVFVLTHRPPDPPEPDITYLTGDIGEAVAMIAQGRGRQEPGDPRRRRGRPVPPGLPCRRDPGVRTILRFRVRK